MTRRRKFVLIGGGALLVGVVVAGTVLSRGEEVAKVRMEVVGRRNLVSTVLATGQISPKRAVDVSSDITARIIQLPVEEGQYVEQGQLLARLQPDDFEANVARAQAALSSAQANALQARVNRDASERQLQRFQELHRQDPPLVSQQDVEDAQQTHDVALATAEAQQFQVKQAEAALREAQGQLAKTVIRAPMAGQITRLAVEEGEVALASTFSRETGLLLTVSDLSVIQVEVRVDETDVVRLALGDSASIEIDAFPDTAFAGRVTRISQSARQAAGQSAGEDRAVDYDVVITLDNPPPDVRPDLSATSRIVTDTRTNAISVPIIALTQREHRALPSEIAPARDTGLVDTEGVFVVQNGMAQFRPVTIGIAGEEHFEVLAGLTEGDSIVAGPYQVVRDLTDSSAVQSMDLPNEDARRGARGAVAAAEAETPPPSEAAENDPALQPAEAATTTAQTEPAPRSTRYAVQVAAVRTESAADEVITRLRAAGYEPTVMRDEDGLYKVRVGDFGTRNESAALANQLRDAMGGNPFVVERI